MSDIFLSHSSKDKEIADKVCKYLEDKGLTCWIAPRDIVPGSDWAASISTAVTSSKVFLLIYSENSAASEQCSRELGLAESKKNVFVVPYKVDNTEPTGSFEYYLISAHWITANYAKKDYKLEELYNLVSGIVGRNVQNITNNTYIDNLHIHGNGSPEEIQQEIDAAVKAVTPAPEAAAASAPMAVPAASSSGVPAVKSKKPFIIGGACAAAVIIAVVAIIAVAGGKKDETTLSAAEAASSAASVASSAAESKEESSAARETVTLENTDINYNNDKYTGTYKGEVNSNKIPEGKGEFTGTMTGSDGKEWKISITGEFTGGRLNGQCTVVINKPNGVDITIECNFENGFESGKGTKKDVYSDSYPDNILKELLYEGSFVQGNCEDENAVINYTFKDSDEYKRKTRVYKGSVKNGNWNGEGTTTTYYNDESEYTEAEIYTNNWVDGVANGQGKEVDKYKNGDVKTYEGEFADGNWDGQGTCTFVYDNGAKEVYTGTYKENKYYQGEKVYYDKDGKETKRETIDRSGSAAADAKTLENIEIDYRNDKYTGTYKGEVNSNNIPEGKGEFTGTSTDNDGKEWKISITGEFTGGRLNGQCTVVVNNPKGVDVTIECNFENGFESGKGTKKTVYSESYDGDFIEYTLEGNFVQGKVNGQGKEVYKYKNGDVSTFEAEYVDNKREGQGTRTHVYADGSKYIFTGTFKDGEYLQGEKVYYDKDGKETKRETVG